MREGLRGRPGLKSRCLVVLFVLLVAVLHGDALHASFPHRSSGLLHGQPVAHCVVHLTVQGGVKDTLQAEVPVLFLQEDEYMSHDTLPAVSETIYCTEEKVIQLSLALIPDLTLPTGSEHLNRLKKCKSRVPDKIFT